MYGCIRTFIYTFLHTCLAAVVERECVECRVSSSSWLRVLRNGSSVEQTCMGRHGVDGVNDGQG